MIPNKWALKVPQDKIELFRVWLMKEAGEEFAEYYKTFPVGSYFHYPSPNLENAFQLFQHTWLDVREVLGYTPITWDQFADHYLNEQEPELDIELLDKFAGQAMQGLCSATGWQYDKIAECAYKQAAAMLEERKKYLLKKS